MIYLLTEQVLNGTVTMSINSTGIEAGNFEEAVEKVKKMDENDKFVNVFQDEKTFSCYVLQERSIFQVLCIMKNEPLKII